MQLRELKQKAQTTVTYAALLGQHVSPQTLRALSGMEVGMM